MKEKIFKNGGLMYRKFQDGGYYPEPDWRGNKYTPGENNIHQAYEYSMAKDYGEGFDIDKLYRYFAAVGAHEGKGNMVMKQDGGGPGRGMFQIEDNKKNGGDYKNRYETFLRIKRLKTPKWFSDWKDTNASNLGKSEQLELMMAYNYLAGNRKNLLSFMRGDISPGELAALNHKRVFKDIGKVNEKGYLTAKQAREKYVKDINALFEKHSDDDVNNILFNNDYKLPYKEFTPDNTTTLTRTKEYGYRCGDGKCALNDPEAGPITEEERERQRAEAQQQSRFKVRGEYEKEKEWFPRGLLYKK